MRGRKDIYGLTSCHEEVGDVMKSRPIHQRGSFVFGSRSLACDDVGRDKSNECQ